MLWPECEFVVEVSDGEIAVVDPGGRRSAVAVDELSEVYVETNDSGPWGIDVWFLLFDSNGEIGCAFPLGASNEEAALDVLQQLDGFQVNGMNSTENKRHLCWRRGDSPTDAGD